jgi:hypothetical protein
MIAVGPAVIKPPAIWRGAEIATASGTVAFVQSASVRAGIAANTYVEIPAITDYLKCAATDIGFWSCIDGAISF